MLKRANFTAGYLSKDRLYIYREYTFPIIFSTVTIKMAIDYLFIVVYCLDNLCSDGYVNGYNLYQYIGLEK
jgi:hypothetical protein